MRHRRAAVLTDRDDRAERDPDAPASTWRRERLDAPRPDDPDSSKASVSMSLSGMPASAREQARASLGSCPRLAAIPPYDEDAPQDRPAVVDLRKRIADADLVLVATPEYNGSIPGSPKPESTAAPRARGVIGRLAAWRVFV
jgi:NADPH-dependent FMN reductase